MTSNLNSFDNKISHRNTIHLINQILDILGKYSDNYEKKLNFTRLMQHLKIPTSEIEEFFSLILHFQEKFEHVFKEYRIKKKRQNSQIYLTVEKKVKEKTPRIIKILASDLNLFNDLIYTFKFVKRGKGFDTSKNDSELLTNLKELKIKHPYLFDPHENGVIYPTELGLKLGELIISYNKSNKKIKNIQIENYTFIVEEDE